MQCVICGQPVIPPGNLCPSCTQQSAQTAFIAGQTPCQQCGYPLDNTGTICNACIARTLLPRPILIGKGTPVSAPTATYVEFTVTMLVGVEPGGGIAEVTCPLNTKQAATGNYFARDAAGNFVTAGVPEPPPKFSSPEEADEWLEANAGRGGGFDVEITQDQATIAITAAQAIKLSDWL